ncbi:uncharacterized protein [Engystomops pustulosus]|uniref:uncharacterized protein n=1 Tax=Engystomops pustulosus TaxID=76066 RepID=UPI003AFA7181
MDPRFEGTSTRDRIYQTWYVDPNLELKKFLATWNLLKTETAFTSFIPDFIQGMEDEDLSSYICEIKRAIKRDLLCIHQYSTACHFLVKVIHHRRDIKQFSDYFMVDFLLDRLNWAHENREEMKYLMTKNVLVWMSVCHFESVINRLRFFICYDTFHASTLDLLIEVISLCAPVVIPHVVQMLPKVSDKIEEVLDPDSRETICHAVRRLSCSVLQYLEKSHQYKVQLFKAMNSIRASISIWLHEVPAGLAEEVQRALEPFTGPYTTENKPAETDDVISKTLPQFHHIQQLRKQRVIGFKIAKDSPELRIQMREFVTSMVAGKKLPKPFRKSMLNILKNALPVPKMTAILFFNEAFKHGSLLKPKEQNTAIQILLKITIEDDTVMCCAAIEALGNAAPRLVESNWKQIIYHLHQRLSKTTNTKVIVGTLRALSNFIKHLRFAVLNRDYVNICQEYLDYADEQVQMAAVTLLKDLTQSCHLAMSSYFHSQVKRCIPSLLVKIHSANQEKSAAATSCVISCLSYVKGGTIRGFLRKEGPPDTSDLGSIYSYLADYHPKMTKTMLLHTPDNLSHLEDKWAVLQHFKYLTLVIQKDAVKATELYKLYQGLVTLNSNNNPMTLNIVAGKARSILISKWPPERRGSWIGWSTKCCWCSN